MAAEQPNAEPTADPAQLHARTVAMNEALILGAVRQHELTDVAERLNAQLQLEIAAREKTASELAEKARLLDLTEDAIIVRNVEGRISYWNHGAEVLYGWSREEALGKVSHSLLQTESPMPLEQITEDGRRTAGLG
jgi:PAS domain-containing protein